MKIIDCKNKFFYKDSYWTFQINIKGTKIAILHSAHPGLMQIGGTQNWGNNVLLKTGH